jgi:hypothetical protein
MAEIRHLPLGNAQIQFGFGPKSVKKPALADSDHLGTSKKSGFPGNFSNGSKVSVPERVNGCFENQAISAGTSPLLAQPCGRSTH